MYVRVCGILYVVRVSGMLRVSYTIAFLANFEWVQYIHIYTTVRLRNDRAPAEYLKFSCRLRFFVCFL